MSTIANPPNPLDENLRGLWRSFTSIYGGLRLFSEQLPVIADRLDEQMMEEIAQVMADVFKIPKEQVRDELQEFLPSLNDEHLYPDFSNQPDTHEIFKAFQDSAFQRRVLNWSRKNPQKAHLLLAAWTDYMSQPPLNGIVLRQSTLINLVSIVEIFVDELIRLYIEQVDSMFSFPERPIWKERWQKLHEIPISSPLWQNYENPLREIIARRNALIHQGGKITQKGYLKQTEGIETLRPQNVVEGHYLLVPTTYLMESFDNVILFAFAYHQSAWEQWRKPNRSVTRERVAGKFIYQNLRQKRYSLVEKLAEIITLHKPEWKIYSEILINRAIAYREQEKYEQLNLILEQLDKRKKNPWQIRMAIHVLRNQENEARQLLQSASRERKLREISLYWPLFDHIRDRKWFKTLFRLGDN